MLPSTPKRFCREEDLGEIGYDGRDAPEDLARWQREGPRETTRELINAVRARGIEGATVMDVGAGVGMVHVSLLEAGAGRALDVDASREFLDAARGEAARRGWGERVDYLYGDVVVLAPDLPPADVVTADKVICCYPYLPEFVHAVTSVHPRLIGLVYPSDGWLSQAFMRTKNMFWILLRRPDRYFIHRRREVDRLLREAGFVQAYGAGSGRWNVVVYERAET